jgi:DNA-binding transcriptional LysR family regulator
MNFLSGLMTFASVVQHKSFSRAAEQMGTTNSAVSKQIAKLESRLKIRLLDRNTRTLTPTDAGDLIYGHCARIMDEAQAIHSMLDQWRTQPGGTLKVSASASVAKAFLSAGMPEFFKRYPDIKLELCHSEKNQESYDERHDIAFLITDAPPPGRVARRLAEIEYVLCASPSYLALHGSPLVLEDLRQHNCLLFNHWRGGRPACWTFIDELSLTTDVPVIGNTLTNDVDALLTLAKDSMGIALLPRFAAARALGNGLLVEVLDHFTVLDHHAEALFAIYMASPVQPPKIRAFIDFVAQRCDQQQQVYSGVPLAPVTT